MNSYKLSATLSFDLVVRYVDAEAAHGPKDQLPQAPPFFRCPHTQLPSNALRDEHLQGNLAVSGRRPNWPLNQQFRGELGHCAGGRRIRQFGAGRRWWDGTQECAKFLACHAATFLMNS
jgi:hypothetical protein